MENEALVPGLVHDLWFRRHDLDVLVFVAQRRRYGPVAEREHAAAEDSWLQLRKGNQLLAADLEFRQEEILLLEF